MLFPMSTESKPLSLREFFGRNLRLERTRAALTQEELAAKVGTDQGYISQMERGVAWASLEMVERLATALDIKAAVLFDETLGRR
ncbi:helix-turn-helix domain-containing protein [Solimonas sp. SE-A11]|uniref:helix-turn-helix domain-containing protein n=1 Tax=Solimonas sp. SE-A11 TaxID=3054954 RepID=UPI00345FAAF2